MREAKEGLLATEATDTEITGNERGDVGAALGHDLPQCTRGIEHGQIRDHVHAGPGQRIPERVLVLNQPDLFQKFKARRDFTLTKFPFPSKPKGRLERILHDTRLTPHDVKGSGLSCTSRSTKDQVQ